MQEILGILGIAESPRGTSARAGARAAVASAREDSFVRLLEIARTQEGGCSRGSAQSPTDWLAHENLRNTGECYGSLAAHCRGLLSRRLSLGSYLVFLPAR